MADIPAITLTDPHDRAKTPQSPVKSPDSSNVDLVRPGTPGKKSKRDTLTQSEPVSNWTSPARLIRTLSSNAHARTPSSAGTEDQDDAALALDGQHEAPAQIDPLSQHIMRRTNAPPSTANGRPSTGEDKEEKGRAGDGREASSPQDDTPLSRTETDDLQINAAKDMKKGVKAVAFLSRLIGGSNKRKEQDNDKDSETASNAGRPEGNDAQVFTESVDNLGFSPRLPQPPAYIKVRARNKKDREFDHLFLAQELDCRKGKTSRRNSSHKLRRKTSAPTEASTIWAMEFSKDGKYLAAAGTDMLVRVWEVLSSPSDRTQHESQESSDSESKGAHAHSEHLSAPVFQKTPVREYEGHTQTILDLSWSKNNFLLSSSMDKTVRLWHVSRSECLCTFKHTDFVPSIAFHPKDDRFFLAGSLDSRLRLWSIPDKSVAYSARVGDMITAVAFTPDGKFATAGCLNGLCVFYETDGFKYSTRIHVRSSRGQNSKGSKITGLQSYATADGNLKLLVSSNDSRIRLYNLKDQSLVFKLKGNENTHSQIRGTISDDGRYVICGSEDRKAFVWSLDGEDDDRRDRRPVEYFEANDTITTVACFAPAKTKILLSKSEDPVYDICNPPPVTLISRSDRPGSQGSSRPQSDIGSIQATPKMVPLTTIGDTESRLGGKASPAYLARAAHRDGNIIVTADYFGKIKVFRQDCAWAKRKPEIEWDRSSMFNKTNNSGKLSRTGSVATRASQRSLREGRASTSTQPSSERILSWRQGVTSTSSVADSSLKGSSKNTSRSESPQKALEMRRTNSNEAAKIGLEPLTPRGVHPLTEAMTASPPPTATPRANEKQLTGTPVSPLSPGADRFEDAETNPNPLDVAGGQSYLYWDMDVWKKRNEQRQRELQQQRAEAKNHDDENHLRPIVTGAHSYVSKLSDERSSDTSDDEHYDDAQEDQMKCKKCGSVSFSARGSKSNPELACTNCGTAV